MQGLLKEFTPAYLKGKSNVLVLNISDRKKWVTWGLTASHHHRIGITSGHLVVFFFLPFTIYLFVYLAVSRLSCGMWDLRCIT